MLEVKIFFFLNRQVVQNWVVFTTPHFPPWDHQQSSSNWDTVALLTEQWSSPILVYDQLSKFVKQRQRNPETMTKKDSYHFWCCWHVENANPTVDGFYCWHRSRLVGICLFTKPSTAQIKAPNARKSRLANPSALLRLKIWEASETLSEYQAKARKYGLGLHTNRNHTETVQMLIKISNCYVIFDDDFVAVNATIAWFLLLYVHQELLLLSDCKQELQSWNGATPRIGAVLVGWGSAYVGAVAYEFQCPHWYDTI